MVVVGGVAVAAVAGGSGWAKRGGGEREGEGPNAPLKSTDKV